jgi:hypothetical protein
VNGKVGLIEDFIDWLIRLMAQGKTEAPNRLDTTLGFFEPREISYYVKSPAYTQKLERTRQEVTSGIGGGEIQAPSFKVAYYPKVVEYHIIEKGMEREREQALMPITYEKVEQMAQQPSQPNIIQPQRKETKIIEMSSLPKVEGQLYMPKTTTLKYERV